MDIRNGVPKRTFVPKNTSNTTAPDTADVIVDGKVTKRRPGPAPKQTAEETEEAVVADMTNPW
jgi:hypothetical protein